jgi:hypothetical protein
MQNVECYDVKPVVHRLAVVTLQMLYAMQQWYLSCGLLPFPKWLVEPLVTYNFSTLNIFKPVMSE